MRATTISGDTHRTTPGGYRVSWQAEIRTRPDVGDAMPFLRDGLWALRDHPEVAYATCRYRRRQSRVEFDVQIGRALTPDFALVRAQIALHESLDRAGLGKSRPGAGPFPGATVRLNRGPVAIQRA